MKTLIFILFLFFAYVMLTLAYFTAKFNKYNDKELDYIDSMLTHRARSKYHDSLATVYSEKAHKAIDEETDYLPFLKLVK